jgi:hypothetical protein
MSYTTHYNNSSITGTSLDIGTLFCDNSHDQTINGKKTFADVTISGNLIMNNVDVYNSGHHANLENVRASYLAVTGDISANVTDKTAYFYNVNVNGAFTGTPRAPTPATDASGTQIVNAAWVNNQEYVTITNTFIYPCYRVSMTYTNSGKQYVKYSDTGAAIQFNYGIYMCTMIGINALSIAIADAPNPDYQSGRRDLMNVEWIRLSETYEGGYSVLSSPIGDGGITRLHFSQFGDSDNRRYMGITGTSNPAGTVILYLIIQRIG